MLVDPARFDGKRIVLRRTWADVPNDYVAVIDGLSAGRIMEQTRSFQRVIWFWTMTGPYVPPHLNPSSGEAETLADAKVAVRAKFNAWLAWAKARSGEAEWHG